MVVGASIRLRNIEGRLIERDGILDTGSRWTWVRRSLADELNIKLSPVRRSARTADNRIVEGVLAEQPLEIWLEGLGVRLWITPIVSDWLASDLIIGNDFMDKGGIKLVGEKVESHSPVGELYLLPKS